MVFKVQGENGLTKSRKQEDRPTQGVMRTVDPTPCRSFEDRKLKKSKNNNHKTHEITICDAPI
jgi:hypothetical protein